MSKKQKRNYKKKVKKEAVKLAATIVQGNKSQIAAMLGVNDGNTTPTTSNVTTTPEDKKKAELKVIQALLQKKIKKEED